MNTRRSFFGRTSTGTKVHLNDKRTEDEKPLVEGTATQSQKVVTSVPATTDRKKQ